MTTPSKTSWLDNMCWQQEITQTDLGRKYETR